MQIMEVISYSASAKVCGRIIRGLSWTAKSPRECRTLLMTVLVRKCPRKSVIGLSAIAISRIFVERDFSQNNIVSLFTVKNKSAISITRVLIVFFPWNSFKTADFDRLDFDDFTQLYVIITLKRVLVTMALEVPLVPVLAWGKPKVSRGKGII